MEADTQSIPATPTCAAPRSLCAQHLRAKLAEMPPAYFALVMATGIVAIACRLFGLNEVATVLGLLNLIAYPLLWALLIARSILFPKQVRADLGDHARAPGYFTLVAATAILGAQAVDLYQSQALAVGLWWFCVGLWAVSTYGVFTMLTVCGDKPTLSQGINGGWLVAVVATQSVCVLGCLLGGTMFGDREAGLFLLMAFWLGGGMLYLWIIALIFYRYMFFKFSPRDFMPPYWINMGAVAISTLAGALLAGSVETSPMLLPLRPFILGFTIMFWATATWWIPMLLVLGVWRHRICKVPLRYDPLYWGLVFPVGMYSVATYRLAEALPAPFLLVIAKIFVVASVAVWTITFLGLAGQGFYSLLLGMRPLHLAKQQSLQKSSQQPKGETVLGQPDIERVLS